MHSFTFHCPTSKPQNMALPSDWRALRAALSHEVGLAQGVFESFEAQIGLEAVVVPALEAAWCPHTRGAFRNPCPVLKTLLSLRTCDETVVGGASVEDTLINDTLKEYPQLVSDLCLYGVLSESVGFAQPRGFRALLKAWMDGVAQNKGARAKQDLQAKEMSYCIMTYDEMHARMVSNLLYDVARAGLKDGGTRAAQCLRAGIELFVATPASFTKMEGPQYSLRALTYFVEQSLGLHSPRKDFVLLDESMAQQRMLRALLTCGTWNLESCLSTILQAQDVNALRRLLERLDTPALVHAWNTVADCTFKHDVSKSMHRKAYAVPSVRGLSVPAAVAMRAVWASAFAEHKLRAPWNVPHKGTTPPQCVLCDSTLIFHYEMHFSFWLCLNCISRGRWLLDTTVQGLH
jgi:hypothetical protein